ncbi:uncharacterized protein BKA78DRAFT_308287 [Phyllosticta capitalensis]|uniref:uncharacterized protein n=1 Tax=Phyllosticta capitalensis TaxID=121624 RepID=UPI00312DBBC7
MPCSHRLRPWTLTLKLSAALLIYVPSISPLIWDGDVWNEMASKFSAISREEGLRQESSGTLLSETKKSLGRIRAWSKCTNRPKTWDAI